MTSVFAGSKSIAFSAPHRKSSWSCSVAAAAVWVRVRPKVTIAISSAYPKRRLFVPSLAIIGSVYSIYRTDETGDPWGNPQLSGFVSVTAPSKRTNACRSAIKD